MLSNYPPNMDYRKVEIRDTDDVCHECDSGLMRNVYWWKQGQRMEQTGDLECEECGALEHNAAIIK